MVAGTTYKSCGCRNENGTRLRKKCPKLRRKGGSWSPTHGTWYYQLELPPKADGRRRNPLRRGGFTTQDAAETEMGTAGELLTIAAGLDGKIQIADLILATVKKSKTLPEPVAHDHSMSATERRSAGSSAPWDRSHRDLQQRSPKGDPTSARATRSRQASNQRATTGRKPPQNDDRTCS
ncbi:hypothetical protein [Actinomadura sp. HBU206391]|uniref:hypothetical protein n=1 Tax=Actinomadura sp. HBU206391 TaxID=2731692 RepID=UPI0016502F52|nr:hypothetical protein [Actinomadura sp. HBU206391]MBC6458258.1 hypothetical protein [Actinomadura sp. HBU206391]